MINTEVRRRDKGEHTLSGISAFPRPAGKKVGRHSPAIIAILWHPGNERGIGRSVDSHIHWEERITERCRVSTRFTNPNLLTFPGSRYIALSSFL